MGERARLVWLMCLPHADKEGRIPGDPAEIMARCLPMAGLLVSDVAERVEEIVTAGMWRRYKDERGRVVIVFVRFHDYQEPAKLKTEKPSKWSDPSQSSWMDHPEEGVNSNSFQLERNGMKWNEIVPQGNGMESKRREGNDPPTPSIASDPRRQEAHMRTPEILREWKKIHPRGDLYELTQLDKWAILQFIRPLSSLVDLSGFLSKAYAECEVKGKHTLADALDKLNSPIAGSGNGNGNGHGASKDREEALAYIARMKALEVEDAQS